MLGTTKQLLQQPREWSEKHIVIINTSENVPILEPPDLAVIKPGLPRTVTEQEFSLLGSSVRAC